MNHFFLSLITHLILLSEKSDGYKIGFAIGSFIGKYWPFLLAGVTIYVVYFFLKRRNKVKAQ